MEQVRLSTTIKECYSSGLPLRLLELKCEIRNQSTCAICILDVWVKVIGKTGTSIAEGKIMNILSPIIQPGTVTQGSIEIQFTPNVLKYIEEQRAGGDVDFTIYAQALVCQVETEPKPIVLGQPVYKQITEDTRIDYHIPQSEWIKHLRMFAWSEVELIELPARSIQRKPNVARALDRFNDAINCYRRGLWDETLMNCRKAFEALIKDTSGSDDMGRGLEAINKIVSDHQKADKINSIIVELSGYLHLARHEQQNSVIMEPKDAQLALHFTGALLAYLG
ncbi:MAG: hypothetical protein AB1439_11755 [candidate division FCPU426 bacterium]